ncbi:hypothetical protein [Treponema endosymbiont of Eucomonympha sp.]|uniref:hypothetical protein n=1 Tax=Treponema endosymbiont of Eucomonympha sp. TaxID=1580831 RepID=UPI0007863F85|nr:hypothetical protein [Treponema endosymbiont of Eucomonympha sp.]
MKATKPLFALLFCLAALGCPNSPGGGSKPPVTKPETPDNPDTETELLECPVETKFQIEVSRIGNEQKMSERESSKIRNTSGRYWQLDETLDAIVYKAQQALLNYKEYERLNEVEYAAKYPKQADPL